MLLFEFRHHVFTILWVCHWWLLLLSVNQWRLRMIVGSAWLVLGGFRVPRVSCPAEHTASLLSVLCLDARHILPTPHCKIDIGHPCCLISLDEVIFGGWVSYVLVLEVGGRSQDEKLRRKSSIRLISLCVILSSLWSVSEGDELVLALFLGCCCLSVWWMDPYCWNDI